MTENDLKKRIYQLSGLTPTEKLTLLVSLTFVDWSSWTGSASINQFAHALSLHRRAISRALKGLTDKGYIERSSKRLGRQMNTRSALRLNIDMIAGGDNPSLGGDNPSLGGDNTSHKGGDIKSPGGDNMSLGGDDSSHKGGDNKSLGGDIKSPLYKQPNNQPVHQPNNQPVHQPNNLKGQTGGPPRHLSNFEKRRGAEQARNRMHALMWNHSEPDLRRRVSRFAFKHTVDAYLSSREIDPTQFDLSDYAQYWAENKQHLIEAMR